MCTYSFSSLIFSFLRILLLCFSFFLSITCLPWCQTATRDHVRADTLLLPQAAPAGFLSANMSQSNLCCPGVLVSIKLLMFQLNFKAAAELWCHKYVILLDFFPSALFSYPFHKVNINPQIFCFLL